MPSLREGDSKKMQSDARVGPHCSLTSVVSLLLGRESVLVRD